MRSMIPLFNGRLGKLWSGFDPAPGLERTRVVFLALTEPRVLCQWRSPCLIFCFLPLFCCTRDKSDFGLWVAAYRRKKQTISTKKNPCSVVPRQEGAVSRLDFEHQPVGNTIICNHLQTIALLSHGTARPIMAPMASCGTGGRCFVVFQLQLEFRGTWSCGGSG